MIPSVFRRFEAKSRKFVAEGIRQIHGPALLHGIAACVRMDLGRQYNAPLECERGSHEKIQTHKPAGSLVAVHDEKDERMGQGLCGDPQAHG